MFAPYSVMPYLVKNVSFENALPPEFEHKEMNKLKYFLLYMSVYNVSLALVQKIYKLFPAFP